MLAELTVENYAVIERVRVRFHPGLNLLTGETGSGKSLVVDALGLLFGGRASAEIVRAGAEKARISGIFEVGANPTLARILEEAGVEAEDQELLVEREIQSSGKSRAMVGSRPVTAALLRELAPLLGDIHGQHDQQQLFSPAVQCEMLDAFGGLESARHTVETVFTDWRAASAELEELGAGRAGAAPHVRPVEFSAARDRGGLAEAWRRCRTGKRAARAAQCGPDRGVGRGRLRGLV